MSEPRPLPPGADAIADAPDDPQLRLVFADWLTEQGRPGAASASRWLAAGNRPDVRPSLPAQWFAHSDAVFAYRVKTNVSLDGMLPPVPGLAVPGEPLSHRYANGVTVLRWEYASRQAAELTLLEAWPDDHTELPS